jgi:hypothetical protein
MSGKAKVAAFLSALILGALILSCSEDSNYDQRAVVYVSSINDDKPFLCDVLNQGDSLWNSTKTAYKTDDDFITEEWVKIVFHNKPYSAIIDPAAGDLGNVLITSYDVSFTPLGGAAVPVQPFTGHTSILVPPDEFVPASILICPFAAKQVDPLLSLMYSPNEIMSYAHVVFHAEEVQTTRTFTFETSLTVNFADPLNSKDNQ